MPLTYHVRDYLQAQTGFLFKPGSLPMDDLRGERFLLLCSQLEDEFKWGWQRKYARVWGLNQNHISQMQKRKRAVTLKTIEKVIEGMPIAREFFTDPKLGASPNYRDFIGKKPSRAAGAAESRIERDPIDESSMDQWTVFTYTDEYKNASEEAKAQAYTLKNQGLDLSVKQYIGVVESYDAMRKGKGVREQKVETPMGANKMGLGPPRKR